MTPIFCGSIRPSPAVAPVGRAVGQRLEDLLRVADLEARVHQVVVAVAAHTGWVRFGSVPPHELPQPRSLIEKNA